MNYKKLFLTSLIVALALSALTGIFIFLVGNLGDMEIKILLTTIAMGGFSLTGFCSSIICNKKDLKFIAVAGMIISLTGFVLTMIGLWEINTADEIFKTIIIFVILSAAIAHISLIFSINAKTETIKILMGITIFVIFIVAYMLIDFTLSDFDKHELFFRGLGVFGILDVLFTILTPVVNKMNSSKNNSLKNKLSQDSEKLN